MYYVEYNEERQKSSKVWEITNKHLISNQEFVTSKIYYRPVLPNGIYSSDDFGIGNKNGFIIELQSPNWHLQKPYYWRLERDMGSGYERIVLYLDRTVEVISAAGYNNYEELNNLDDIIVCTAERATIVSNTDLAQLKAMKFYERRNRLKRILNPIQFTENNIDTNLTNDFHTPGLTSPRQENILVPLRIEIIRLQTLRRIPTGGGAGISQAIAESELIDEKEASVYDGVVKKRVVAHHFENGGLEIICSESHFDTSRFIGRIPERTFRDPENWTNRLIATIRLTPPDRFKPSGYFIEKIFEDESDKIINLYFSEDSNLSLELSDEIVPNGLLLSIISLSNQFLNSNDLWEEFHSAFFHFKARKWDNINTLPRENHNILEWMRSGLSEPWTWSSMNVNYSPINIGTQLITDLFIGFIPVVGDILDISELIVAVFTGRDRWRQEVKGWDYFFLSLSLIPFVSGLHRRIGSRSRRINENLMRLNRIPQSDYRRLMNSNTISNSESRRLIRVLFETIFEEMPNNVRLREIWLSRYLSSSLWKRDQLGISNELFEALQLFSANERHQLLSLAGIRNKRMIQN